VSGTAPHAVDRATLPADPAALAQEGGDYARAYLATLHTPRHCPRDLVNLVQFLSGPMLEGFCGALHAALCGAAESVKARP
jgi:hypothetical protein